MKEDLSQNLEESTSDGNVAVETKKETKEKKHYILGHPIIWCIIAIPFTQILSQIIASVPFMLASEETLQTESMELIQNIVANAVYVFICFLLVKVAQHSYGESFHTGVQKKNAKESICFSLVALLFVAENIIPCIINHDPHVTGFADVLHVIVAGIAVGFAEEFCCRTFVIENAMQSWGKKKYGIKLTLWVSALGFGLLHLMNLTNGESTTIMVLVQVFYASALGLYFGAIYLRTRNLWGPIILHGLIDVTSFYFMNAGQDEDPSAFLLVKITLLSLAMFISGLYLTRKSKMSEIEKEWGQGEDE